MYDVLVLTPSVIIAASSLPPSPGNNLVLAPKLVRAQARSEMQFDIAGTKVWFVRSAAWSRQR